MPDLTPDIERELAAVDDALAGRPVPPDLTELGELALLLRDERPEPSPAFGPALDAKVARGFSAPYLRRRKSGRRWSAWTMPALGATASVLLVAVLVASNQDGSPGDSGSAGGGSSSSAAAPNADSATATSAKSTEAAPSGSDDAADSLFGTVPPASAPGSPRSDGRQARKVERSASLTLAARPRDIDAVSAKVQDVTRQQGGFVASSTVSSSEGGGGGTFELRIPTRNLDAAIAALARLGKVRERAQKSNDITAESVSAASRLTDARTERSSLLRQLAKATTPAQTASIRARLRIVSHQIAVAQAGVRRVNNRAAYSTVALTLVADSGAEVAPATDDSWTPGDAAKDALRVLEVVAGVALITLAIALPLALLALLAALSVRWGTRRRRERTLDAV
jgi:hypothetical protein